MGRLIIIYCHDWSNQSGLKCLGIFLTECQCHSPIFHVRPDFALQKDLRVWGFGPWNTSPRITQVAMTMKKTV
jgi:hypothetical protein